MRGPVPERIVLRRPREVPASRQVRSRAQPASGAALVLSTLLAGVLVYGWPYYMLPGTERIGHPMHAWLGPSGYVGQSAGIIALGIFAFLWLYPLRKRCRWLSWTGSIPRWLDAHVAAALLLPLLVAIHAGWRFSGVVGLGFWTMMLAWSSGLVGRYIYARIPRSQSGIALSQNEITAERKRLLLAIARTTGLDSRAVEEALQVTSPPRNRGPAATIVWMLRDDLSRSLAGRRLRRLWAARRPAGARPDPRGMALAAALARREAALTQQSRLLRATHDLFRRWHVVHRPLAVLALTALLVHVATALALGTTRVR